MALQVVRPAPLPTTRKRSRSKLTAQRKNRGEKVAQPNGSFFKLDPATIGRYIHVASNVYGVHMTYGNNGSLDPSSLEGVSCVAETCAAFPQSGQLSVRQAPLWPQMHLSFCKSSRAFHKNGSQSFCWRNWGKLIFHYNGCSTSKYLRVEPLYASTSPPQTKSRFTLWLPRCQRASQSSSFESAEIGLFLPMPRKKPDSPFIMGI